ncbi:hypothetical protein GCM10020221_21450 [Streptomyces thioluteus]|uniref:Uncharacterized protein n=1 Tax=Streptomyces thioluteus TaxID=66431 RepID=A0ABN3WRD0_STRTU
MDVWVNNAFATVFAPFVEIEPDEFRRATEVTYLGCVYGTQAALSRMLPRDHGHDRPGRLGAGVPGDPAAVRVLRGEARDPGYERGAALRAPPPGQQGAHHDGAVARDEHPAVPLGALPPARAARGRCRRSYQPEVAARAIVHAAGHPDRREHWVGGSTVATLLLNAVAPGRC